jgi:hypothetical protein
VLVAYQTIADYVRVLHAREQAVAGPGGRDQHRWARCLLPPRAGTTSHRLDQCRLGQHGDPCAKAMAIAPDVVRYLPALG